MTVDNMQPWTIKSFPTAAREQITADARREGLTVGQYVERGMREWKANGQPVSVEVSNHGRDGTRVAVGELVQLMQEARAFAEAAGVPVPPSMAREAFSLVRQATRRARGLPPRQRALPGWLGTKRP